MRIFFLIGRVEEWLGEIFSGGGKRYEDSFSHENRLKKVFLYRSGWIVISSL